MSQEELNAEIQEDPFADSDEWIAGQARQLFRARSAEDAKAVEVELFYLEDYLTKTLRRHMRQENAIWDGSQRWFDGLNRHELEYLSSSRLRIAGELA